MVDEQVIKYSRTYGCDQLSKIPKTSKSRFIPAHIVMLLQIVVRFCDEPLAWEIGQPLPTFST